MADDFVDLDEFLTDGWTFRIKGRQFTVPEVEWPEYLELAQLQRRIAVAVENGGAAVEGDQWYELAPRVLGPVLDELIAAGVRGPTITMIARSAYFFQLGDKLAADQMLLAAFAGKVETPTLPESGSTSTTPTGSTSSESETGTKRPDSSTATRSPRTSSGRSRSTKVEPQTADAH